MDISQFSVAQMVNLPAMQQTGVRSQDGKDPPKKGTATPSSMLAWRIPWTEEPGGLLSMGWQSQTTERRLMLENSASDLQFHMKKRS